VSCVCVCVCVCEFVCVCCVCVYVCMFVCYVCVSMCVLYRNLNVDTYFNTRKILVLPKEVYVFIHLRLT
jgi:hypothetical protein